MLWQRAKTEIRHVSGKGVPVLLQSCANGFRYQKWKGKQDIWRLVWILCWGRNGGSGWIFNPGGEKAQSGWGNVGIWNTSSAVWDLVWRYIADTVLDWRNQQRVLCQQTGTKFCGFLWEKQLHSLGWNIWYRKCDKRCPDSNVCREKSCRMRRSGGEP